MPRCMLPTTTGATHGLINVMKALAVFCNHYFYEAGYRTGITAIDNVRQGPRPRRAGPASMPEAVDRRANPETKKELYDEGHDGWYDADTSPASIEASRKTASRPCSCAPTRRRSPTAVCAIRQRSSSACFLVGLSEAHPREPAVVASTLDISDEAYAAYSEGMREAVTSGTAHSAFVLMDVAVCAKTGTAQHGSGGSDNASFVLYAPADDPEIAIAVYVEKKGAQGGTLSAPSPAIF